MSVMPQRRAKYDLMMTKKIRLSKITSEAPRKILPPKVGKPLICTIWKCNKCSLEKTS